MRARSVRGPLPFVPALIASVAFLAILPPPACAYQQEIKRADSVTRSGKKTVAVVDFTDLQGNVTELGRFLAEELSVSLASEAKGFEVVDRAHLKALLQEHKLAATGIIDPSAARRLGQIAGVELLVTGNVTAFGDSVRLSTKLLDASTAKMLGAANADIPKTKAIEELLARGVGVSPPVGTSAAGSAPTPSPSSPQSARLPGATVSQEADFFFFALKSCRRTGQDVVCFGSVTNRAEKRRRVRLGGRDEAVDNAGNQYTGSGVLVTLGAGQTRGQEELESDLPMNFLVRVKEVHSGATSLTLILEYSSEAGSGKLVFRNLPLQPSQTATGEPNPAPLVRSGSAAVPVSPGLAGTGGPAFEVRHRHVRVNLTAPNQPLTASAYCAGSLQLLADGFRFQTRTSSDGRWDSVQASLSEITRLERKNPTWLHIATKGKGSWDFIASSSDIDRIQEALQPRGR